MNPKMTEWLHTSIYKHFTQELKTDEGLPFVIEGIDRRVNESAEQDLVELRVDGPIFQNQGKGQYTAELFVNILIKVVMNETDAYRMNSLLGIAVSSLTDLPVREWTVSGQPMLGCLKLQQSDRNDRVRVNNYGQLDPAVRLLQGVVEGTYRIELED